MRKNYKLKRYMIFSALLIISFVFLGGIGEAARLKVIVIVQKANIRLKPDINSPVIARVPIGTVLVSEEKEAKWYRFNLPPDESGFIVSGYIHESIVEIVEETKEEIIEVPKEEKVKEVKPPEVTPPVIKHPVVKEEKTVRVKLRYVPKRVPKRNFALSVYPSYGIVSMGDLNKIIDAVNDDIEYWAPDEEDRWESLKGGLDFFFEGRYFLLPKVAIGFGAGLLSRKTDFISDYSDEELKLSGIPLNLSGYYYPLPENKVCPYLGFGIGMLFYSQKLRDENGGVDEGKYSGTAITFQLVSGAEYFLMSYLSIGGELAYRIVKIGTIKVKRSDFYGEDKGEILMWDPSYPDDAWFARSKNDMEYYKREYGYERLTADFSGLSIKLKISFYF